MPLSTGKTIKRIEIRVFGFVQGKAGTVFGAILVQEEVITFSPSFIAFSPR